MMFQYAIAMGSNRRHGQHGLPAAIVAAAARQLPLIAMSRVVHSRPIGPSQRIYANAAAIIESHLPPPDLLSKLKAIERQFGRRAGQRWGARALDLDIILWSGGIWADRSLAIPHVAFRDRDFVLAPMTEIEPDWRDPVSNLSIKQLKARLDRNKPRA